MKNGKIYFAGAMLGALLLVTIVPLRSDAATATSVATYQPRTKAEMIAYLYGRISQLLEIKQSMERSGGNVTSSSILNYVIVETRGADDVKATTATLRGEATIAGKISSSVWFEYGQDEDFLDLKTGKKTVSTIYDRAVRIPVTKLEDDQRYYFRIVSMDKTGTIQYGEIYQFRTDELDV